MVQDCISIGIGDIQKLHEKIEFEKKCTFCQLGHGFTLLPLFQKVLAFPQFLRYDGEIDMIYHAWIEYDILKISR